MMKPLHWISCACVTAAGMFFSFATAGAAGIQARGTKPIIDQSTESFVTGDLGVNFLSQYVARGIVFENEGVIAQPYADIYFRLYKGDGFVNKVSLNLAFWSSIHSEKTFAPMQSRVPEWFEQDYKPGLSVTFAKNFTLSSAYCWYTSPSGAFRTPRAINSRLDFNDADLLGAFALHPYFTYLRELENKVGNGFDQGNYFELGIVPALPKLGPLSVTVPMAVGFGTHQFYLDNERFGYYSGGLNFAVPLQCIPAGYGKWTFNAGVTYFYMHGALAKPNAIRGDNPNDFVFNGGVGAVF